MKLFLSSSGIRTQELADALADLVGKNTKYINVAVINEASAVEPGDKTWFLDEMADLRRYIGGEIDFIDLLALDNATVESRLEFADVIYVVGGNPDYLMHLYEKTGFDQLLRDKLLDEYVYVGSSAGSMVLGRRASAQEYQEFYGEDEKFGTEDYMGIVDFVVKPHFRSPDLPKNHEDILREKAANVRLPIYALEDTQAAVVDDTGARLVGLGNSILINA